MILTNRLILNLRTHDQSNDLSNPTTKTDIFFRQAYGGSRIGGRFQTAIDSVLGNIGAPLRVGEDEEPEEDESPSGELEDDVVPPSADAVNEGRISLESRSEP